MSRIYMFTKEVKEALKDALSADENAEYFSMDCISVDTTGYGIDLVDCTIKIRGPKDVLIFPRAITIISLFPFDDEEDEKVYFSRFYLCDVDTSDVVYVAGFQYLYNRCPNLKLIGYKNQPVSSDVEKVNYAGGKSLAPYYERFKGRLTKAAK